MGQQFRNKLRCMFRRPLSTSILHGLWNDIVKSLLIFSYFMTSDLKHELWWDHSSTYDWERCLIRSSSEFHHRWTISHPWVLPPIFILNNMPVMDMELKENDLIKFMDPMCPQCRSRNIVKNSTYLRTMENGIQFLVRRYICRDCRDPFVTGPRLRKTLPRWHQGEGRQN